MDWSSVSINFTQFRRECGAVDLPVPDSIVNGIPQFPELNDHQTNVMHATVAAHGQEISSDECLALRSILGSESAEWDAYVDAKLEATRESRRYWYFHEADDLFMDAMATMDTAKASASLGISQDLLDRWIEKRQEVADAIPPGTEIQSESVSRLPKPKKEVTT